MKRKEKKTLFCYIHLYSLFFFFRLIYNLDSFTFPGHQKGKVTLVQPLMLYFKELGTTGQHHRENWLDGVVTYIGDCSLV